MKPRVLVSREVFDETLAMLAEHFEVESNQADVRYSAEELAVRLAGKQGALMSTSDRVDAALLERCPDLRVVSNVGVGYNNIDVAACTARGVMVTNTPGVLTDSVADLAFGLIIAGCRRLTEAEHYLRRGEWKGSFLKQMLGVDVHGSTLGIIGMGRIGQAVARRALGFDMNVIYHNRSRLDAETEARCHAQYRSKDDLLREADIVLLLMPYSAETHHLVAAREIELMKPSAVLVNAARGGIVDDGALVEALRNRRIFGAALDVYENEPNFHPGFLELRNVVLSPHIASASEPTRRAMANTAARNCIAALTTGEPPNLLNPESGAR
ncbi:MAG: D-glycerate dehydrogenase [Betaproteobacteria bacterium]|jgi:lactate dehydrogenase-like 2-hydroxyacid dehydrogenase